MQLLIIIIIDIVIVYVVIIVIVSVVVYLDTKVHLLFDQWHEFQLQN